MTQLLRVMIVDDEAPAREGLRLRLKREDDVLIIGEFGDVRSAIAEIERDAPDVLFLDIEMPVLDGFDVLKRTSKAVPAVVFVTAHDEHAVRAFDARAFDYLLKPVEQARLHETLGRAREHLERERLGAFGSRVRGMMRDLDGGTPAPVAAPSAGQGSLERIPVTVDGTIRFIAVEDIDHISAAGDTVVVHTARHSHTLRKSMGEMLATLDATRFVRIHRSTIVNTARIEKLEPYFHGEYIVVTKSGAKLKLSRGYRSVLAQLLGERTR